MDLLLTKYLKAVISYEGIQRIETYPVPDDALREAVLNAVIHRNYGVPAPIQIRVYADRLWIWNPGELPADWSLEALLSPHSSQPFNPDIASVFSGQVRSSLGDVGFSVFSMPVDRKGCRIHTWRWLREDCGSSFNFRTLTFALFTLSRKKPHKKMHKKRCRKISLPNYAKTQE